MLNLKKVHHIAIICSDYQKSKAFYTQILGFEPLKETFRENRDSYKLDLTLNGRYVIELFSFPDPPARVSRPEAAGLRHLAFEVDDLEAERFKLLEQDIPVEPIRTDEITGKKFTFFADPDGLPLELYES
jgi:glyoxylase I family protein